MSGAFVRMTFSGAGCGATWPLCHSQLIPNLKALQTFIEFHHRASSSFVLIFAFLSLILSIFLRDKIHIYAKRAISLTVIIVIIEALLGAGLVIFDLVDKNASWQRAVVITLHLTNTLALLASLTVSILWVNKKNKLKWSLSSLKIKSAIKVIGLFFIICIFGALTALSDTVTPTDLLGSIFSKSFVSPKSFLEIFRPFHPILAIIFSIYIIVIMSLDFSESPQFNRLKYFIYFILLVTVVCGASNIFLKTPITLQLIHLLFAYITWLSLIILINKFFSLESKTDSENT